MAPSITIGAVILLWRKAATNVIVCHAPSGTAPITRAPRGARPLSRTILVVTADSSINTSRAGSSMPCSRIQRRRARATSARCCSAASDSNRPGVPLAATVEGIPERRITHDDLISIYRATHKWLHEINPYLDEG